MIFCVEDDDSIRELEMYTLRSAGFEAEGFADAAGLYGALKEDLPELILLDVMLPGEDGISILHKLRADPRTARIPVIMATAKSTEVDIVTGLDGGADDYLTKPFGLMEMLSHIRAVLRRVGMASDPRLCMGVLSLDQASHTVTLNGAALSLSLKEFDLLHLLMAHPDRVFTREELLSTVWNTDYIGETRTVDMHIANLRTKLGSSGSMIHTVRGVGYKMTASGS